MDIEIKKGSIINLTIESITDDGMGVARKDNLVYFVIGGITGDLLECEVIKKKKNYAIASISSILRASNYSVKPYDKYFGKSGGSTLSRMQYDRQLIEKQRIVNDSFERIASMKVDIKDIIGMEHPFNYRNKSVYPCGYNNGKVDFGYYRQKSHQIVFEERSIIDNMENAMIKRAVAYWANTYSISAYQEDIHKGILRYLVIRVNDNNEFMVGLVTNAKNIPYIDKLVDVLCLNEANHNEEKCDSDCSSDGNSNHLKNLDNKKLLNIKIVSLMQNINKNKGNLILTQDTKLLWGQEYIKDKLGNLSFNISLPSFFQVNRIQTQILYDKVVEFVLVNSTNYNNLQIWDLYCGTGTISLYLSQYVNFVRGNEISVSSIENARQNALSNGVTNVYFEAGDCSEVIPTWLNKFDKPDVIVVDPPRKGCDKKVLDTLILACPQKIVYVSCKPSTLARDVAYLKDYYHVELIQPVDMFPHTAGVECVVLMSRRNWS